MRTKVLGVLLAAIALCATPANAQNVETLYTAIAQLETSLEQLAANEAGQRDAQLHALRGELAQLEQRLASAPPDTSTTEPEFQVLAERLSMLVTALKHYVEENPRNETADGSPSPDNRFSVSGQIRHRSEVDGKAVYPDSEALQFHLLRTRIGVTFQPLDEVDVFIQMQDARTFGSENPAQGRGTLDGSADALDFHQAYFAVRDLFGTPLTLKVGRQELAYGNQRLIGSVGWSNVGRTFNAATASYSADRASFDLFTAKLVDSPSRSSSQNLYGLNSTFDLGGLHLADAFALIDNNTEKLQRGADAGKSKLVRYTVGTYLRGASAPIDYEVEAIYQAGTTALTDSLARASIGAYLLSGALGYTLNQQKNVYDRGLYTRLLVDNDPADGTARTFNTLFATNHKFYGYLDYFPKTFTAYGLQDFALRVGFNPTPAITLNLDLHHFALEQAAPFTNDEGALLEKRTLGEEIDVTAKVKYNKNFSFVTGASLFLADDLMQRTLGKETGFKLYLMTIVNF